MQRNNRMIENASYACMIPLYPLRSKLDESIDMPPWPLTLMRDSNDQGFRLLIHHILQIQGGQLPA